MPEEAGNNENQGLNRENSVNSVLSAFEGLPGFENIQKDLTIGETPLEPKEVEVEVEKIDPNNADAVAKDLLKKKVETPATEVEEEETEEEETETEKDKVETVIDSPVFGGKKVIKTESTKKPEEFVFEGKEKVESFVKEKTGLDNLEALVSGFSELKTKSEEFEKTTALVDKYEGIFAQLPTELYQGIDAFLKGQDWKAPIFSKPNLDFAKDVDTQNLTTLVENYLPGQFSKEEWEDYNSDEPDPGTKKAIDLAISTAKKQYGTDKTDLDNFKTNQISDAQKRNEQMNKSVEKSIDFLKKNLEGVDDNYIKKTRQNLSIQKLNELFFDKDGNFNEQAALRITMAEHGNDMLEQYKIIAKHQSETTERQEILERTPATPKVKKKSEESKDSVRPEVQARIDEITKGLGKTTVY